MPATDWRVVRDASMLGTARRDGRAVDLVSFYDPTVPAWYEGEVDRQTRLPLRMRMTAAAHFMTHAYGAFNAPLEILPPTARRARSGERSRRRASRARPRSTR